MALYSSLPRNSSRADCPLNPGRRHRAEVERLTKEIKKLIRGGAGNFDEAELADLEAAREAAMKQLRHADLAVLEARSEAGAVLTPKVVEKIRAQRRRAYDSHANLMTRIDEFRRLLDSQKALAASIESLKDSREFKFERQEMLRNFGVGADVEENLTRTGRELVRLERDLARTVVEQAAAQLAKAEAQSRWTTSKAVLDRWEQSICDLGPAARRVLADIPKPGGAGDRVAGFSDIATHATHSEHQAGKNYRAQFSGTGE